MEMDTNESEAAQMDTKAYQEAHVITSTEDDSHSAESDMQLKQQGLETSRNTGNIHNGECSCSTGS